MKSKFILITTFVIGLVVNAMSQTTQRYQILESKYNGSDMVFEGVLKKKNPSYKNAKNEIHTTYEVQVTKGIKGTTDGSVVILDFEGGTFTDPGTGMISESTNSHGANGAPLGKTLYFVKSTAAGNRVGHMMQFQNPTSTISNPQIYGDQPYLSLTDYYADLSTISGVTLKVEKKSPVTNENKVVSFNNIPYERLTENYNSHLTKKKKSVSINSSNAKVLSTDLDLAIANTAITGSGQYYEFDIQMSSNTSSNYFDNTAVHLSYNTAVFGSSVVTTGGVQIANAPALNNPNYINADSYKTDISGNVFAFAIGTDPLLTNPTRVSITTSYQNLAHVKMKIINCGSNTNLALTNASLAINVSFYATTATSSVTQSYDNLYYGTGTIADLIPCGPYISDFTSPLVGGLGNPLTIKGYNFGAVRGNGQVKFRNADEFGLPYMNLLDNMDYVTWTDTLIQIRMPSTIDTINPSFVNTPGSGDFKVVTNAGDSVKSNYNQFASKFKVYYSIYNTRPGPTATVSRGQKLKANLYKSVASTGGYVLRLDTSVGNYSQRKMCVKKAIKDWNCLTGSNLKLGNDTAMAVVATDNICNVFIVPATAMPDSSYIALTKVNTSICPSTTPLRVITDFDIRINEKFLSNFFYDTTLATLPAYKIDFLEVMYHEIGHGLSLMHVNDSSAVMYWRTLGNQPSSIPGASRRRLIPYTSDVDGGDNAVSTSQSNVSGQCGLQDMVQLSSGSCAVIGVHELSSNYFNTLIYPNPTNDGIISISFDGLENVKPIVEVRDVLGKEVLKDVLSNPYNSHYVHSLNLNSVSSGVYFLNIRQGNASVSFKLIKQ